MRVEIKAEYGDITTIPADVVVLKFARGFHGADAAVAMTLADNKQFLDKLSPQIDQYVIAGTEGKIAARYAMFVGVLPLMQFRYGQIRNFSKLAVQILGKELPDTRTIAMTMHGVGYGLDETESLLSQLGGLLDALQETPALSSLKSITIVEKNQSRAKRIQKIIEKNLSPHSRLPGQEIDNERPSIIVGDSCMSSSSSPSIDFTSRIDEAGEKSETKPHIYVAMPFCEEMDDVYVYGIQSPVHASGYLCERVDLTPHTGDVLERMKTRIDNASLVIADLTGANPNVYLEVGYAWGRNRPTILITKNIKELKFNVHGQRCIEYKRIMDLEKALLKEIQGISRMSHLRTLK